MVKWRDVPARSLNPEGRNCSKLSKSEVSKCDITPTFSVKIKTRWKRTTLVGGRRPTPSSTWRTNRTTTAPGTHPPPTTSTIDAATEYSGASRTSTKASEPSSPAYPSSSYPRHHDPPPQQDLHCNQQSNFPEPRLPRSEVPPADHAGGSQGEHPDDGIQGGSGRLIPSAAASK